MNSGDLSRRIPSEISVGPEPTSQQVDSPVDMFAFPCSPRTAARPLPRICARRNVTAFEYPHQGREPPCFIHGTMNPRLNFTPLPNGAENPTAPPCSPGAWDEMRRTQMRGHEKPQSKIHKQDDGADGCESWRRTNGNKRAARRLLDSLARYFDRTRLPRRVFRYLLQILLFQRSSTQMMTLTLCSAINGLCRCYILIERLEIFFPGSA